MCMRGYTTYLRPVPVPTYNYHGTYARHYWNYSSAPDWPKATYYNVMCYPYPSISSISKVLLYHSEPLQVTVRS